MTKEFTAASYMEEAQRALSAAHLLLSGDDTEGVCNRAYYAMFDAAHAALIATGHEAPQAPIKTHHTLVAEFGKKLVLGGHMDASFGRSLNKIQAMRLLADYSAEPPSIEDARKAVEQAGESVEAVRRMVSS